LRRLYIKTLGRAFFFATSESSALCVSRRALRLKLILNAEIAEISRGPQRRKLVAALLRCVSVVDEFRAKTQTETQSKWRVRRENPEKEFLCKDDCGFNGGLD
jgi:hypothetical protein